MTTCSRVCVGLVAALVSCNSESALDVSPGEPDDSVDGKADAAMPKTELKVAIAPADIRKARARLSLYNDASETRRIWFFDTPGLALFEANTILRAREIDGDDDDSTVKLRPFTFDQLATEFRALDGLKCEIDRSLASSTQSCSLKDDRDEGDIAAVGRGDLPIDKLFDDEQEAMYAAHGPAIALAELVPLGPIRARVWTITTDLLPEKVTAEIWYMPDGTQTLELSMKLDTDAADAGLEDLQRFVSERSLAIDKDQESKTRRALEAFAAAASSM